MCPYPAGPLGTEEGRYIARWHYPYSPLPTRMPHVYLPHKFYGAPLPPLTEVTGQVGLATHYVDPIRGYGYPNLPAVRGFAAEDTTDADDTDKPSVVDQLKDGIMGLLDYLKDKLGLDGEEPEPVPERKPVLMYYAPGSESCSCANKK